MVALQPNAGDPIATQMKLKWLEKAADPTRVQEPGKSETLSGDNSEPESKANTKVGRNVSPKPLSGKVGKVAKFPVVPWKVLRTGDIHKNKLVDIHIPLQFYVGPGNYRAIL